LWYETYKTICLLIVVALILNNTIFAQQHTKTEANADIVEYTSKEGLPTTNISKIFQTKDGYIWLSGIEGTFRFDGYDFDEIGREYGVQEMQNIYYDLEKNIIYFASPEKFIVFNGNEFKVFGKKDGYKINGLSGQVITLLDADSKGRIWIGSATHFVDRKFNGGLTMFENDKFTVYDSTSFPLHNATTFIETPYGDLIFGSNGKNTQTSEGSYIAVFKQGKFKRIDESLGVYLQNPVILNQKIVTSIDNMGNTWIAFQGVNTFTGNNNFNDQNTSGVLMYDGNKFRQYPEIHKLLSSKTIPILAAYSKTQNKFFLTTASPFPTLFNKKNKNILEFENGKWQYSDFFKEVNTVKNLRTKEEINDYSYWATVFTKANRFFPELLAFVSTSVDQSQSSKYPTELYSFNKGNWSKFDAFNGSIIGELKDGVLLSTKKGFGIYYPNKSKMLTKKDGLLRTTSGILNLDTDRNGIVWISYSYSRLPAYANIENAGINIWDGTKLHKYTEKDGLKSNVSFSAYQDTKFRVWIPTSKGITVAREIRNNEGNWIFKFKNITNNGSVDYNVTNVMETKSGDIYAWQNYVRPKSGKMTAADFYLGKFDGEKFVEIKSPFDEDENSKKYQMISLKEGISGNIWIEGLFSENIKNLTSVPTKILIYDGKKWSAPPKSWNVPKEQLHYVGELANGMYFLTVDGFYNFNGEKFINLSDSVDTNADFRILKGASVAGTQTEIQAGNKLYIRLRNKGLVIFDGKHLNFYTIKDGLPSADISNPEIDFNGNVTFGFPSGGLVIQGEKFQAYYDDENIVNGGAYVVAKDINGNLLRFYNGVGLYVKNIEHKNYPLRISAVAVNSKYYFYNYPKEYSYSQNSFQFSFAALNYKEPNQTKYEHFLEGYDKDWSRPTKVAFSEYQNLSPGEYTFRIRGITSNEMKTNEATYSFVINPPIWQTWWAYSIYVLFLGFVLGNIRKYETRRIKLKETNRLRKERSEARVREAELRAKAAETQSKLIRVEHDRKTKELKEARQLQLSMLPKELPNIPNLDIAVCMQTATEVGGDYYDYHIHSDGTFTIVLGDATGHGMQAGMMVSIMKSLFMSDRANKDLLPFYTNTNSAIKDMRLGRLMMALTTMQFDGSMINTINAGMPPVLLYDSRKEVVKELTAKSMPLGAMKNFPYSLEKFEPNKGDTIMLFSDGLPELLNESNQMFGYERVKKLFSEIMEKSSKEIVDRFKHSAQDWAGDKPPNDDVTFVVLKMK